MDDQRIGRSLRAIRHQKGWRQIDVARKARLSQAIVSRAEAGEIGQLTLATLRKLATAIGAEAFVRIRWRGADLDRLIDEGHATLVGAVVELLTSVGWVVHTEVSFSVYGERGSIDVAAWHEATRTLLVIEVKTELVSIEETIRILDVKVRLAPQVVAERFGWQPLVRSHLLVLPARSTQRRQVARHAAVLGPAFPVRGQEMKRWLSSPDHSVGGLLFVSLTTGSRTKSGVLSRKRVRLTASDVAKREAELAGEGEAA